MNRETIIQMAREAGLAEVTDTNQKLREALQLIAWSNDSKWQADCARQALALQAAEQVDDINVAESFTSVTKTAAPVGERERTMRWVFDLGVTT